MTKHSCLNSMFPTGNSNHGLQGARGSLTVRCHGDRLAWLQGSNDKWRPDLFRISFGFQCDGTTNYFTQFIQTDFFSINEPLEAPVRANEHVLITVAIPAERLINFSDLPRTVADERIYWGVPVDVNGLLEPNSPLPLWRMYLDETSLSSEPEQQHSIGESGGYEEVCQVSLPGINLGAIKQAFYLFDPDKLNEWVARLNGISNCPSIDFSGQSRFNFRHPLIRSVDYFPAGRFWIDHAKTFAGDHRTANDSQFTEGLHMTVAVPRQAISADGDAVLGNDAKDCRAAIRFHLNGTPEEMPNDSSPRFGTEATQP